MDKFIFGVIAGFIICVIMVVSTEADGRKDAVKDGWIKIDGEVYTLHKADVVEVKSQNLDGDWEDDKRIFEDGG